MDGNTKQRCSDWSSPMELDMSVCPGTVIRPDMPLGSGPAKNLQNPSAPIPMTQQDLSRCPSYYGSMKCPDNPPCPMPAKCPEKAAASAPMKCPEKPACQKPVKWPQQGVSPAMMRCPEMPPKPMKCPEQAVSPAVRYPEMPPCRMKCPEMPHKPMKCPERAVFPAVMKCPEMPHKPMKCPERAVSPAVMRYPDMPPCPRMYPDMPPCCMKPNMPMGMAPGMYTDSKPAKCTGVENIDRYPVGMTYVPWQRWQELYSVDTAIEMGTIFPDLFKPFLMGGCR